MRVIVIYDIDVQSSSGKKRMQRIAKRCLAWGVRIQNSVFECDVDASQYREMTAELSLIIDQSCDKLRFYSLGNKYKSKILSFGIGSRYYLDDYVF